MWTVDYLALGVPAPFLVQVALIYLIVETALPILNSWHIGQLTPAVLIIRKFTGLLASRDLTSSLSGVEYSLGLDPLVEAHARLRELCILLQLWTLLQLILKQNLLL